MGGGTRTPDPRIRNVGKTGHLVDFAARLATEKHAKTPLERSSCTYLVLAESQSGLFLLWFDGGADGIAVVSRRDRSIAKVLRNLQAAHVNRLGRAIALR